MEADADPLQGATAHTLRIRFYVDGYYAYLLARQVIKLHLPWLHDILQHFPKSANLFDKALSPDKQADLVLRLLTYVEDELVGRCERALAAREVEVISKKDVDLLRNKFVKNILKPVDAVTNSSRSSTYVDADSYGLVFCPKYNKRHLIQGLEEFKNNLLIDEDQYAIHIKELNKIQKRIERGDFERTKRFYDALADRIGDVSDRGMLKPSFNVGRRPIEEKGVDGDYITALAFDAADDLADVYVLLTNDSDHAPAAERLVERGKKVILITYAEQPARALRLAVGDGNVVDLLTNEREFDFDPIWLLNEDARSLQVLEDMRMQWTHWKAKRSRKS